jgi:hypothetical protein
MRLYGISTYYKWEKGLEWFIDVVGARLGIT